MWVPKIGNLLQPLYLNAFLQNVFAQSDCDITRKNYKRGVYSDALRRSNAARPCIFCFRSQCTYKKNSCPSIADI